MADEPELLAAIRAAPNDAKRYAVYGDWLQARGDPRGELISVDLALRSITDVARFTQLRALQQKLLDEIAPQAVPIEGVQSRVELRWRWGFVHQLALMPDVRWTPAPQDEAALLKRLLELPVLQFVQAVRLCPSGTDAQQLVDVLLQVRPPVLSRIALYEEVPGFAALAAGFPRLEHLALTAARELEPAPLARLTELRTLELDVERTRELREVLRAAPWLRLEKLSLHVDGLSKSDLQPVLALPDLREVALSTHEGVEAVIASPRLRQLTVLRLLAYSEVDRSLSALANLEQPLPKLKVIVDGKVSDDVVRKLRKRVKGVVLSDVRLTEAIVEAGVHTMTSEEVSDFNPDDWN